MPRANDGRNGRKANPGGGARLKAQVLAVVAAIPHGRISTYGVIARHVRCSPRQVAFVLARLTPEEAERVPWFRVIAAGGVVSSTKLGAVGREQIKRLRAEGVAVTPRNKVEDFAGLVWTPG
ncbi:MAG: MGMT family protein [Planctomycetia bacterium]|nr:MGMT family protein [Planctomycetia bacterium]